MKNDENIVSFSMQDLKDMRDRGEDRTDWERVRNMTDEEVEANIDYEAEGRFDFSKPFTGIAFVDNDPPVPDDPHLLIATDVIDWFQRRGPDYERQIEDVLRAHIAEQQRQAS